jgi:8-oxo-dGTP diphosphatase
VPPTFTVAALREVYGAVKGHTYDPGNFHRRFERMQTDRVIVPTPGEHHTGTKPARVHRFAGR